MMQMVALTTIHIRHNAQRSRNVTGWDQKFKIQRFQSMIMLHIKLNEIANAATHKHIFSPYTHPRPLGCGQMHKNMLLLFSENSHVAYQIRKEWSIEHHASTYSIFTHTHSIPGVGSKLKTFFSESSHAVYQIKGNGA